MGRDVVYQPCPTSPTRLGEKMKKIPFGSAAVAILVFFVLFIIFLGLYLGRELSEPAEQLRKCQSEMQNQSSQMQAQITSLGQRMIETQEKAKKEAGIWSDKLEAVNKTLAETQKDWHSCQNQLSALQDNFTSLEARERSQTATINSLQQQLSEKSKQLDDEERKSQEERWSHQAEIQQLREQLVQKEKDDSNTAGGSPSIALLTILMARFLTL